jgi:rfaE bifunctional protein kinase chain/domain/rfaE bifunctional protein nucleotidyltransferase chain/domain
MRTFPGVALPVTDKLCSLSQLLAWRERARETGRTVVHCHGCFDVVHPGHIHHLQHAKSLGDLLVVSVSSDAHVNKGVSRPLIPDDLRAASLAALECVDAVYLNEAPTAVELLTALRPDVYVKGREYETSVDPRFLAERDAVLAGGGEMFFSSGDVVYSSTALINALTDTGAFNTEKVTRFARQHAVGAGQVDGLLRRMHGMKVLVIGDSILDRYHFCEAVGVAGESPMMSLRALATRNYDGGAAIVARHAASLGAAVTLVTALADDDASEQFKMRLASEGVATLASDHRKSLVEKDRYLVDEQKMLKIDRGSVAPLDARREASLAKQIIEAADGAACVIFADFGYGLITQGLLDRVLPALRKTVPVLTADVSGKQTSLLRFHDVDLLCPTERELRETIGDHSSGIGAIVSELLRVTNAKSALLTLGKQGLVACDWPGDTWRQSGGRLRTEYLPALAGRAVDPLGAGDALLAAASLSLATGASLAVAAYVGSLAAAVAIGRVGNLPITPDAILDAAGQLQQPLAAKVA